MVDLENLRAAVTAHVPVPPGTLYDMVADITRMGEWSPVCTGGRWDAGATGRVGDWFTGTNRAGDREWETRAEVVAADRGREFAFVVGGAADGWVRWGYEFGSARDGGTDVTERWQVLRLVPRMGDGEAQLLALRDRSETSMRDTLDALRAAATSSATRPRTATT